MNAKWITMFVVLALVIAGLLFAQQKYKASKADQKQQTTKADQKQETSKADENTLSSADRSFITLAAEANLAEIETAKTVQARSKDSAEKDFANRMITDHTQASQNLATLAKANGITLGDESSANDRNQKDELQKLSSAKLGHAYLRDELQDHKQAISEFESEIEHGHNQAVTNYAEQTLPTLEDHIRIAENLAGKLGMSGKTGLTDEAKAITVR